MIPNARTFLLLLSLLCPWPSDPDGVGTMQTKDQVTFANHNRVRDASGGFKTVKSPIINFQRDSSYELTVYFNSAAADPAKPDQHVRLYEWKGLPANNPEVCCCRDNECWSFTESIGNEAVVKHKELRFSQDTKLLLTAWPLDIMHENEHCEISDVMHDGRPALKIKFVNEKHVLVLVRQEGSVRRRRSVRRRPGRALVTAARRQR